MKKLLGLFACFVLSFPLLSFAADNDTVKKEGATLAWLKAVDQNEIDVSKLAEKKADNADVKGFAKMMVKHHGENMKEVASMGRKLKVKLTDTDDVKDLKKEGKEEIAELKAVNGKEFDNDYMKAMVKGHSEVSDKLDKLISDTDNSDLKMFLTNTRDVVKEHLKQAEEIKGKLD